MKALVLKKTPYGDSDLIITMLTESGRILKGFAAGAKRSRKRFPHQFSVDGYYDVDGLEEDRLARLHRCDLIHFNSAISKSWDALCLWAQVSEWIGLHQDQVFDFDAILELWESLGSEKQTILFLEFFIREMKSHGLAPQLEHCVICRESFALETHYSFVIEDGGMAHLKCRSALKLDHASLQFLKEKLNDLDECRTLSLESQESLNRMIVPYLEWQMGQRLKSRQL